MTTGRINQVTRQSIANGELPGTGRPKPPPARRDPSTDRPSEQTFGVGAPRSARQLTNFTVRLRISRLPTGEANARRGETTRAKSVWDRSSPGKPRQEPGYCPRWRPEGPPPVREIKGSKTLAQLTVARQAEANISPPNSAFFQTNPVFQKTCFLVLLRGEDGKHYHFYEERFSNVCIFQWSFLDFDKKPSLGTLPFFGGSYPEAKPRPPGLLGGFGKLPEDVF